MARHDLNMWPLDYESSELNTCRTWKWRGVGVEGACAKGED